MTGLEPESLLPPTVGQIFWSPERAILAALDASLLMATRMLASQQDPPDQEDPNDASLAHMARSVMATATSLRVLLAGYDDVAERVARRAQEYRQAPSEAEHIPF